MKPLFYFLALLPLTLRAQIGQFPVNGTIFGSSNVLPDGLAGKVYKLPETTVKLPNFEGLQPFGELYTKEINVSARNWTEGFPGVPGTMPQVEWFGIEYTGFIKPSTSGLYEFRIVSDDGAKLFIDDKLLISNDGIHPPSSASSQINLNTATHSFKLQYFQGPRDYIALQVFVKTQNGSEVVFPGNLFTLKPLLPTADETVHRHGGDPMGLKPEYEHIKVRPGTWTTATSERQQDILFKKIDVGTTQELKKVKFRKAQANLLPEAKAELLELCVLLKNYPTMTIELAGHTDNVGPAEKNQQLSQRRVEEVKAYLVRQGIAAARITGRGYGGSTPLASNDQEATRQLNRRVEVTITGLD